MKTSFFRRFSASAALFALAAAVHVTSPALSLAEEKTSETNASEVKKAPSRAELLQIQETDNVIGAEDAPVTMIEYASMSCSHCAGFHKDTFPKLKEKYIDTGKLRFVLRDFPLNRPAVLGATIARCAPKEKYYKYVSALFSQQSEWLSGETEQKLKAIATMGGMSEDDFYACVKNKDISDGIVLKSRYDAVKSLSIRSTPTFFINGITYEGAKDYDFFSGALDKLIKQAEKNAKASKDKPDEKIETKEETPVETPATDDSVATEPSLTEKIVNKVKETATDIKKTLKDGVPSEPKADAAAVEDAAKKAVTDTVAETPAINEATTKAVEAAKDATAPAKAE